MRPFKIILLKSVKMIIENCFKIAYDINHILGHIKKL